jgi:hypothetical protein
MAALNINISKCSVLHLTSTTHRSPCIHFINGIQIPTYNSSCIDLGLTVRDDLSFHTHISCIISNARQRSSTLLRGFLSHRLNIMRTAFITYICPLLEFNNVVWNPCHKYLVDSLENVQRNFTKRIPTLSSYSYYETRHAQPGTS